MYSELGGLVARAPPSQKDPASATPTAALLGSALQ